jgi:hypothetical protein
VAEAVATVADTLENTPPAAETKPAARRRGRGGRKAETDKVEVSAQVVAEVPPVESAAAEAPPEKKRAASKAKAPARPRRTPRKKTEAPAAE